MAFGTARERLRTGMLKNGYSEEFAAQIFEQIRALAAMVSPNPTPPFRLADLRQLLAQCHEPAAFACALITAGHGFYSPDQILQDARRHRLQIRPG